MKYLKYILLFLLFIFTSCGDDLSPQEKEMVKNMRRNNELRQKQKEEEIKNRWKGFHVEVIDSCEYLVKSEHYGNGGYQGYGFGYMAHKGNCKFCKERRKKELKEYEQRQYERFTRISKDSL